MCAFLSCWEATCGGLLLVYKFIETIFRNETFLSLKALLSSIFLFLVCPAGRFGRDCSLQCSPEVLGHQISSCRGLTFCVRDPKGCSCLPGYQPPRCDTSKNLPTVKKFLILKQLTFCINIAHFNGLVVNSKFMISI